ncbi:MAG: hypothetical protein COA80_09180 [Leeuwenhoekiella sp.]|nr:MAG: hypothetical protein COA80_09180 [Leeuwenhoekiella sp.]
MRKLQLLFISLVALSCSSDSDETEQIAETGFPFKVTVLASEIENNIDTKNRFQIDLEKGAASASTPVFMNEQLGFPRNAASRLIDNTISFQLQEGDVLNLWRKNLATNQTLGKEEISLKIPLAECSFPYPIPVGNKLITTCFMDNQESVISYDYSNNRIQKAFTGENKSGWGSNTLVVRGKYLFFGYDDYNIRLENQNPSRFIDIYEWSSLNKVRTINVDPYEGFGIDQNKILMGGSSGYKLYDFVNDRVLSEGERLIGGGKGQFFTPSPIINNKIAIHDYRSNIGYTPGIFDFSSKQTLLIDRNKLLSQFDTIESSNNLEIVQYEVHLKFEIAVIGYRYYDSSNNPHYGVAYVTMDSEVLSKTELPYYPGSISIFQ